jgi:hypothetical protein
VYCSAAAARRLRVGMRACAELQQQRADSVSVWVSQRVGAACRWGLDAMKCAAEVAVSHGMLQTGRNASGPSMFVLFVRLRAGQRTVVVCIRCRCAGRLHLRTKPGEGRTACTHAPQKLAAKFVTPEARDAAGSTFQACLPTQQAGACVACHCSSGVPCDGFLHSTAATLPVAGCVCRLVLSLEDCK